MDALGRKWGDTLAHAAVATESPIFERLRRGEALLVRADLGVGGLAIALGDVVDDAIIDTENIYRRLRGNQAAAVPRAAHAVIYDASLEVRFSVVYASFIVALVFVPLLTLSGVAGRLFAPLGSRYILALLASLAVALTVTPALSALLLNRSRWPAHEPPLTRWLQRHYRALVRRLCRHATPALMATALACALLVALLPALVARCRGPRGGRALAVDCDYGTGDCPRDAANRAQQ